MSTEKENSELEDLNKLKSHFISLISHEFRTPLTIISSSAELLQYYFDSVEKDLPKSIYKNFGRIRREVDAMSGLMDRILEAGRLESSKASFNPEPCDMRALCNQVILEGFSDFEDNRFVEFSVSGNEGPIEVDPRLFIYILRNLLSNAFKYSDKNPKLILNYTQDHFVLRVVDQGIGIPEAEKRNVFESFYRASNTKGISGTGLGLVVVKELSETHHGHIRLESKEGKGTSVDLKFPKRQPIASS